MFDVLEIAAPGLRALMRGLGLGRRGNLVHYNFD